MDHLRSHTGLRGVAALVVAPVHMYCEKFVPGFEHTVLPLLNGALAVDVFFVLSGFILPYVYHDKNGFMNSSWRKFFIARFARIYPLHVATIAIAGLMALAAISNGIPMGRPYHLSDLLPQLLLIHAFPHIEKWAWIHPSWSISMEFLAYIAIFPLMTHALRRCLSLSTKVAIILGLCGLYLLTYSICTNANANAAMGWYAVGRVSAGFGIGFLIFKIYQQHPVTSSRIQDMCDWILATFVIAYFCASFNLFSFQWLIFLVPPLILSISSNKPSYASRILGNRVMVWLGTISYSVYLLHTILGKIVVGLSSRFTNPSPYVGIPLLIGVFTLLLIVSALSHDSFENPARKWLTKRLSILSRGSPQSHSNS